MNLKQAEIVLEKITRLYESMKLDERNIDVFEQDLMLSYIRQLYESFSPEKPVAKRIHPVLPPKETASTPKPVAKEPVKAPPVAKVETPKVVQEPTSAPKVVETPKVVEQPKIVEKPKVVETPKIVETPKVVETPKPSYTRTPPPPRPQTIPKVLTG